MLTKKSICHCLGLLSVLVAGPAVSLSSTHAAEPDRPNIVWLVSEDNSIHYLDLYVKGMAKTPAISKLAEHGVVFNHAFSNAPVCSVARTTLATGCYGPRIGTQYHRKSVAVPMPSGLKMFSELLTDAGYYTGNNRKTDYNAVPGAKVWTESSGKASWRNRRKGQPFFYMQSFATSHEGKLHFSEAAMKKQKTRTAPQDVQLPPYFPDTPTFRYTHAKYQDLMTDVDAQIGNVVTQLTQDGLLEDTFIFYFGDHGGVLPRGKGYAYESGLHVPLVVRIPKNWAHLVDYKPGERADGFVSFIDFGPTVLNLANVKVPEQMDGVPFLGDGVSRTDVEQRDEAFGYADRFDEKYDLVRTLRKGRYEYVRNFQPFNPDGLHNFYRYKMLAFEEWRQRFKAGKLNDVQAQFFRSRPAEQLFDISRDPHEVHDLSQDPKYGEILIDLRTSMSDRMKAMPDLSFYPESTLATKAFDNPVQFGKAHQPDIAKYVTIANLQCLPFEKADSQIRAALQDDDPLARYWGCITCSAFGTKAKGFVKRIRELAESDEDNLVRTRAAECLGLMGQSGAESILIDCVNQSETGIEAGLILNSVTLLRDHTQATGFDFSKLQLSPAFRKNDTVARRLDYLLP